jgi:succinylglutamate desuccinylase
MMDGYHRRAAAAEGVVTLELSDPHGDDLPAWEPGAHVDLLLGEGLHGHETVPVELIERVGRDPAKSFMRPEAA